MSVFTKVSHSELQTFLRQYPVGDLIGFQGIGEGVEFAVDDVTYSVAPGTTIATLLPLTNNSAGPGLEHWDPRRWNRHRLVEPADLASVKLVTAFGHGRHSCPAQQFSLAAMAMTANRLFGAYELTPDWESQPVPLPVQIGGIARAAGATPVSYRRR